MKLVMFLVGMLMAVLTGSAHPLRPDSAGTARVFEQVLAACKARYPPQELTDEDYRRAAPLFIFRSANTDRKKPWKTFCDPMDNAHLTYVQSEAFTIAQVFDTGSRYKIEKYECERQSEGEWHVLTVVVKDSVDWKTVIFAFLRVGGRYGLGDIDHIEIE